MSLSHSSWPNPRASAPGSVYTSSPAPPFTWPLPTLLLSRGHHHHAFLSPCVLEKPSQSLEIPPPLSLSKPPVTVLLVSQLSSSDRGVAAVDTVCVPHPHKLIRGNLAPTMGSATVYEGCQGAPSHPSSCEDAVCEPGSGVSRDARPPDALVLDSASRTASSECL